MPARFAAFWRAFRRSVIWRLLAQQRWWILALVLLGVVNGILLAQVLGTVRAIVDDAIIDHIVPLQPLISRLLILSLLQFGFGFANAQVADRIGWTIEYELRNWIYDRMQRIRPHELDSLPSGQLVTRAAVEFEALERFILLLPELLRPLILLVAFTIIGLSINLPLGLLAFSALPLSIWVVNRIRGRMWVYQFLNIDQRAVITTAVDEPIRGIRLVKAFGREQLFRHRVQDESARAYTYRVAQARFLARYDVILDALPAVVRGVVLVIGAWLAIRQGSMSVGTLLVFLRITAGFAGTSGRIDEFVNSWQRMKTSIGRVQELITWSDADRPKRDAAPLPDPSTGLELRNVSVSLGRRAVLNDLNLTLRPGAHVVVTGRRGAGKTTVAAVASAVVEAASGDVILDGVPLSALDPVEVRQAVRVLSEEPFLFARTVRENLRLGAAAVGGTGGELNDERLEAALAAAGADDVLEQLEQGLDTVLGDRGLTLSGGQRQRIGLARALVVPPRILVLDDALSAVPPRMELEILARIRQYAPQTAILSLSRREGPDLVADEVVDLPEPSSAAAADVEAVADEVLFDAQAREDDQDESIFGGRQQRREVTDGLRTGPYDPALVPLIAQTQIATEDIPKMRESDITDPVPPGVRRSLRPFRGRLFVACLFLFGLEIAQLIQPALTGRFTDAVNSELLGAAVQFGLGVLVAGVFGGLLRAVFRVYSAKVDGAIMYLLRRKLFHRFTDLGVDYYDRRLPGEVATRVVYDLAIVSSFTDEAVYLLLRHVGQFLLVTVVISLYSPEIAIYLAFFVPAVAVVTALQAPFIGRVLVRIREWTGAALTRLQEDFAGRYVIDTYGGGLRARREYHGINDEVRQAKRVAATIRNGYTEVIRLLGDIATVVIFMRAGDLVLTGAMTIGTLVAVDAYFDRAIQPIPPLARIYQHWLRVRVSLRKLADPYSHPILPPEPTASKVAPGGGDGGGERGAVEFENVTFSYPHRNRTVLADISFEAAAGETVAIVGPTGAGKSSIAKLISRTYDPSVGRVLVDGVDLCGYPSTHLRERVAVVPQDGFVFRGTVWDNIGFGRPGASQEDIETAALAVGAYDALVAIPEGAVEEEGRNLTPAQRQLIALARAWLVGPAVLVLDEATAALDENSETAVLEALAGLECTKILITHRQRLAERADFVLVIEHGRIVQAGTHDDLLLEDGVYKDLWLPAGVGASSSRGSGGKSTRASTRARGGRTPRTTQRRTRRREQ